MRGIFVDGPFKGNCCVLEYRGKRVDGLKLLPMLATKPFRGNKSILLATPCDRNEPGVVFYEQKRNSDGSPMLNFMGDILYRLYQPLTLHLHLKFKWYDQIASGQKPDEMRLATDKWRKRLIGKSFDQVCLYRGYPKKCDYEGNRMFRKFGGVTEKTVTHEEFGSEPVEVFVIDVSQKVDHGK